MEEKNHSQLVLKSSFLCYRKRKRINHTIWVSPNHLQTQDFFQLLSQFFSVAKLKGYFKPDLCSYHHKKTLVRQYKSTVFLHKLVIGSHREDRTCSCSYIQLAALDWKKTESLHKQLDSEMCTASSPPSIQQSPVSKPLAWCHAISPRQSLQDTCL